MKKKKSGRSKNRERMIEADNYRQGNVQGRSRRKTSRSKDGTRRRSKAAGIREDNRAFDRTDMSIAQMQRRRRRRRQKELARKKRKFYMTILLVLLVMIFAVIAANKKKPEKEEALISQDDRGLSSDVPENRVVTSDYNGTAYSGNGDLEVVGEYPGAKDIAELLTIGGTVDTTAGQSAVDLSMLDSDFEKVQSAKAAMKQKSYFTGTTQTVDSYLQSYAPGEWYGIMDAAGDVCVFYEGEREERISVGSADEGLAQTTVHTKLKVVFIVYEDGSFMVQGVSIDDAQVDDYQEYLMNIINGSM